MTKIANTPMTSLPKKFDKILKNMPEYIEMADRADIEELKKIIISSEGNIFTIVKAKEADVKLSGAKELVKDLNAPYKESIDCQNAKIQYALLSLESKGIDFDTSDK